VAKKRKVKRKAKTHRGAAKRFKVTAGGKVKRGHSGKRHMTGGKMPGRMRRLRRSTLVHESDAANVKKMLPYA
jgi:large subunit ribosomal protein L35